MVRKSKFERCVLKVKKKNKRVNPFAVCRASLFPKKKKGGKK